MAPFILTRKGGNSQPYTGPKRVHGLVGFRGNR